jgi:hypothetical protein
LTALAGPDGGVAYIYHHDEYSTEIVADQAGLLYLAAALAQTAALAEAEPDAKQTGPFTDSVFKEGSDSRIWFSTYDPTPAPRAEPGKREVFGQRVLTGIVLTLAAFALIGLVAVVRWAL